MRGLLSVVAAASLLVPVAQAAKKPPAAGHTHTTAGMAKAHRLLLTATDFPKSWTRSPPDKPVPGLTCGNFAPSTIGIVETGAAASPHFAAAAIGPFVFQTAYVYATAAQARTFWRRAVRPELARCLSQTVAQGSTQDVRFTVGKTQVLALPRIGERSAAYRVPATATIAPTQTTPGQTVPAYFDLLLIGRGTGMSAITLVALAEPVSNGLELAFARAAARRLAAG